MDSTLDKIFCDLISRKWNLLLSCDLLTALPFIILYFPNISTRLELGITKTFISIIVSFSVFFLKMLQWNVAVTQVCDRHNCRNAKYPVIRAKKREQRDFVKICESNNAFFFSGHWICKVITLGTLYDTCHVAFVNSVFSVHVAYSQNVIYWLMHLQLF